MEDMKKIIAIEEASFSYESDRKVFDGISIDIYEGESVGIIGANGSGKSTLLKMIAGLLDYEGQIDVSGIRVEKKNLAEVRRKLGLVFQDSDSQLFMPRVYDDMAFAPRNYGYSEEETEKLVEDALSRLDIEYLKDRPNHKLSGGEKRLVCIATILAMKPEVILMDEPSIALDPYNRRNLINNLKNIKETRLIASHDLDMILETCGRVVLIKDGKIYAEGKPRDILSNQELLEECHLELPLCLQKPTYYSM